MDTVADELQCPICLELFTHPVILPCSHILCQTPCADRLFEHGFVRCPVCRDNSFVTGGLHSLPRVLSLENIIERYQSGNVSAQPSEICGKDDIACQLCEKSPKRAKKSCLDCNASYCETCLRISHPAKEPFVKHQLVEPRRYPKPRDQLCPAHQMKVNIFCQDCRQLGCVLCADDEDAHPRHKVLSLGQAAQNYRRLVEEGLSKIEQNQHVVAETMTLLQGKQTAFQTKVMERRSQLNEQCDSLVREIEIKRELFLSDLEFEEKSKQKEMEKLLEQYQENLTNLQCLQHLSTEILKETDTCAFLQLSMKVSDRLSKNLQTVENLPALTTSTSLFHKVLDLRRERAQLRSMEYLTVPDKPVIFVEKCSRSVNSVVLVLNAPTRDEDIVDGYQVFYCSEDQKRLGDQDSTVLKMPTELRRCSRQLNDDTAICLIHENLQNDTTYYFCVQAYNQAGASEMSEIVNCRTLPKPDTAIPVPDVSEPQCRTYTFSIQIYSTSPKEAESDTNISHFLLYRESAVDGIWKSIRMYDRTDHRIFALEPDTSYDILVMACHKGGKCQMSKVITMHTENAAF